MSSHSIRILSAALAAIFILMGSALPGWAGQDADPQNIEPPFISTYRYPDKTALELMQLGKDMAERKKIEARQKAGEKIEYGQLSVTSRPEGAGVLVSSYVPLGKTPYTNHKLLPGLQRVTVRKDGYYEQVRMVEIKANRQSALDFKLKPIPYARLTVKLRPATTKVKIVDVEEPYTPGMKLVPGRYLVSLSHPMYGERRLCAVLRDNEEVTLNGDLAVWPGKIKISSTPSGATVYVDGQEVGQTPYYDSTTWLTPGQHLVQVWKSLFKPTNQVVHVGSNKIATVNVDLAPVEHFTNSLGMEFVKIPAGKFMMGVNDSPELLASRIIDGMADLRKGGIAVHNEFFQIFPQHLVEITKPFFMQTTEVTIAQWDKVMGAASSYRKAQSPKVSVSIKDARLFIAKLNLLDKGKYHYRLPTEAEWEYAARAGTKGLFYTGDYITTDQANFMGNAEYSLDRTYGKSRYGTVVVKSYSPNPWGLYDMFGNIKELCADYYDGFYYADSPVRDPIRTSKENGYNVARGGAYVSYWPKCLSREPQDVGKNINTYGFRLAAEKVGFWH